MAKTKPPKETLEQLLDRVSDARETLTFVERPLSAYDPNIAALDKCKGPRKPR